MYILLKFSGRTKGLVARDLFCNFILFPSLKHLRSTHWYAAEWPRGSQIFILRRGKKLVLGFSLFYSASNILSSLQTLNFKFGRNEVWKNFPVLARCMPLMQAHPLLSEGI